MTNIDWLGRWTIQSLDRGNGAGREELATFWLGMTDPVIAAAANTLIGGQSPDWLRYIRLNRVYILKEWSKIWLNGTGGECLCLVYQCVPGALANPRQRLVMASVAHLFHNGVGAESAMRALIHGGMRLWPPPSKQDDRTREDPPLSFPTLLGEAVRPAPPLERFDAFLERVRGPPPR